MSAHIQIKLFATLKRFLPAEADHYPIGPATSVAGLQKALGIGTGQVKLIFINGVRAEPGQVLNDGDRVGMFPPVGGG